MQAILGTEKKDKQYIIYPFITGFLLLGIYLFTIQVLNYPLFPTALIIILCYSIIFDMNHHFSTYYRVFLDKEYYRQNKKWIITGLAFVTLIPIIGFFGLSRNNLGYQGFLFYLFFRRFILTMGFYHLLRQNWGFIAMYKGMNKEKKTKINWDKWTLLCGGFVTFLFFCLYYPMWFQEDKYLFAPDQNQVQYVLDFWHHLATACFIFALLLGIIYFTSKKFQYRIPAKSVGLFSVFLGLLITLILDWDYKTVLWILIIGLSLAFIVSLIQSIRFQLREKKSNPRKWWLIITSLVLYAGIILYPAPGNATIKICAITLPHNIQYLAFVPYFSRKRFQMNKDTNFGIAKKLSKKLITLFLLGMMFAVVFELGRSGIPYILPKNKAWQPFLDFILIIFWVFVSYHYYLDAIIWKFSKNKELNKTITA